MLNHYFNFEKSASFIQMSDSSIILRNSSNKVSPPFIRASMNNGRNTLFLSSSWCLMRIIFASSEIFILFSLPWKIITQSLRLNNYNTSIWIIQYAKSKTRDRIMSHTRYNVERDLVDFLVRLVYDNVVNQSNHTNKYKNTTKSITQSIKELDKQSNRQSTATKTQHWHTDFSR